jgi:type II secretory pathway pseudopilin PulG
MKIERSTGTGINRCAGQAAFTLIEVAFAAAIAALLLAGMFQGYNLAGRRAQFSACSLAANTTAMGQMEKVIAATWVPSPPYINNLLLTLSSTNTTNLCLPSAQGSVVTCTNITTVTLISSNPPYAMIQVQCVWGFPSYGGTFTNTVAVLRAPTL